MPIPSAADHPACRLPTRGYSLQRLWELLSDDEWAVLSPFLHRHAGPGRPVRNPRARLDAIFWLAASTEAPGRSLAP